MGERPAARYARPSSLVSVGVAGGGGPPPAGARPGPADEAEASRASRRIFLENLRSRDVTRHEVGCELNPTKLELDGLGERPNHECFREARDADEERVTSGEQRHEDLVEHVLLPDDAP